MLQCILPLFIYTAVILLIISIIIHVFCRENPKSLVYTKIMSLMGYLLGTIYAVLSPDFWLLLFILVMLALSVGATDWKEFKFQLKKMIKEWKNK